MRVAVVVNPVAGHGKTRRKWPEIEAIMRDVVGEFTVFTTEFRDHATLLTQQALRDGYDRIVSVGGDGTHHEVLNGFFDEYLPINPMASLAIVPMGTGSDLARTLGIRRKRDAVRLIKNGRSMQTDIGRVTYTKHDGSRGVKYFLNIADFGIGGSVVDRVDGNIRRLGPTLAYAYGLITTLLTFRPKRVKLQVDGEVFESSLFEVIVANGQYFGGGIHVAREARLDSGTFQVIAVPPIPVFEALFNLRRLYNGSFVENPKWARNWQATRIVAQSDDTVLLDLDGEGPGRLPCAIELLPKAIKLVIGVSEATPAISNETQEPVRIPASQPPALPHGDMAKA